MCVLAFGACVLVPTDLHKTTKLKWVNIFSLGATFSRNLAVLSLQYLAGVLHMS